MCTCIINQNIKAEHGNLFVLSFCDHFYTTVYQLYIYFEGPRFRTLHASNRECLLFYFLYLHHVDI